MHPYYPDGPRDGGDMFQGSSGGSHQYPPQLGNMQVNMDVIESLMAMQDQASQQQGQQQQTSPQALMEQQIRLNQLQQLQQLQNQIFQQQIELLSGQSTSFMPPPVAGPSRDGPSSYGLPTPVASTELRPQQNTDFVSPMLLHSNNSGNMGNMLPNTLLPNFIPHHMVPNTPHSAPANIVFQSPSLPMPSPSELDFNEISPITSPWLGPYNNASHNPPASSTSPSQFSPDGTRSSVTKRRNTSPSGDESNTVGKPARKKSTTAVRTPSSGSSANKKVTTRSTRSANSTPLFPPSAPSTRPSSTQFSSLGLSDVPGDTPSPIDPPMPPPTHPASYTPPSADASGTPPLPPTPTATADATSPNQVTRVTPSGLLQLGRLAVNTSSSNGAKGSSSGGRTKEAKSAAKAGSSKSKANDKAGSVPLASPALKPIRPAGPAVATPTASPSTPFVPPQFRKSSHKAAEQKRRDSLKTSFDDLRILLPPIPLPSEDGFPDEPILPGAMPPRGPPKGNADGPNRGVSKLQLLRCGNEFIRNLKGRIERRDEEIQRLRDEVRRLRAVVGKEAAAAPEGQEMIDLERDLDACEISFVRPHSSMDGDAEEDGISG